MKHRYGYLAIFIGSLLLAGALNVDVLAGPRQEAAQRAPERQMLPRRATTQPALSVSCQRAVDEAYGKRDLNRPADQRRGPERPRLARAVKGRC